MPKRAQSDSSNQVPDAESASRSVQQLLHDLKQPLTAIGSYALAGSQLIDQGRTDPARLQELFDKIAKQGERATRLSQDLDKAVATLTPVRDRR